MLLIMTKLTCWIGYEDYRDKLFDVARKALAAEKALDKECKENGSCGLSSVVYAIKRDDRCTSQIAEENAECLMEICKISAELVSQFNFDPYFIQREYESILSPS